MKPTRDAVLRTLIMLAGVWTVPAGLAGPLAPGPPAHLRAQEPPPNALTPQERAEGWRLLFDGETLDGWRAYGGGEAPPSWRVEDGTLHFDPDAGEGGDLLYDEAFSDFELALEWRISPGGNSGIFFRVSEDREWPWQTGPEVQVLDDARHPDGRRPETSAGSNFALHAPARDVVRPAGEWNRARIVVRGSRVEHWLNGIRIVEYELWSDAWEARVAESKFATMTGYGRNRTGYVVLQDHGDPVWFRSVTIRPLR